MASKYLQKFPIPGSFPDLLHDFAREVLRDQPEDIYDYGAQYFKALDEVISWCNRVGQRIQLRVEGQSHPTPQGQRALAGKLQANA